MLCWLKRLLTASECEAKSQPTESVVTDWDVAQAFEKPELEPEAGRVEYRFLGVTGFEEDV